MRRRTRMLCAFLCLVIISIYAPSFVYAIQEEEEEIVEIFDNTTIDTSRSTEGCFSVYYSDPARPKMKVGITYGGKTTYCDYTCGDKSIYTFTSGNGDYMITLYSQVSGTKYRALVFKRVKVNMNNDLAPYLASTREVSFTKSDSVSRKAAEICKGLTDDVSKVIAIHEFIHDNIEYDDDFAAKVQSGDIKTYLPKATKVLRSCKGICYDFATLFAAMSRSQGVPCRIKKGYYRNVYHAWNEVYLDGLWYKVDSTISINKEILKKKSN